MRRASNTWLDSCCAIPPDSSISSQFNIRKMIVEM